MKTLIILLAVVVAIIGGGTYWFASNGEEMLRAGIETEAPKAIGAPVHLAGLSLSPWRGAAGITDLVIANPAGYSDADAVRLGAIAVKLKPMSLFSDLIEVEEVRITDPEIRIEPGKPSTNLQAIQKHLEAFVGPAGPDAATPIKIDDFYLTNAKIVVGGGRIGFSDQSLSLADIHLQNIGGAGGVAPADAAKLVFDALMPQVNAALSSELGRKLMGDARQKLLGELENKAQSQIDAAKQKLGDQTGETLEKGLGGLLGKKKLP